MSTFDDGENRRIGNNNNNNSNDIQFFIHSTFRDDKTCKQQLLPHGLQWDMNGTSIIRFVPIRQVIHKKNNENEDDTDDTNHDDDDDDDDNDGKIGMEQYKVIPVLPSNNNDNDNDSSLSTSSTSWDTPTNRRGIIEAYNRWCFAKDLSYHNENDIVSIQPDGPYHLKVLWKEDCQRIEKEIYSGSGGGGGSGSGNKDIVKQIEQEYESIVSSTTKQQQIPTEVWINGLYIDTFGSQKEEGGGKGQASTDGTDSSTSLQNVITALTTRTTNENRKCIKKAHGLIRIDRYYSGALRRRGQIYEHIVDNLIALEDIRVIDEQTIIGTATLEDWIMGGNLTSRLWIYDSGKKYGPIKFLRPLYNDDITTKDRKYELKGYENYTKIICVRKELSRLRFLASTGLSHPSCAKASNKNGTSSNNNKAKKKNQKDKYFNMVKNESMPNELHAQNDNRKKKKSSSSKKKKPSKKNDTLHLLDSVIEC